MKLLVAGSRGCKDQKFVNKILDELHNEHKISEIISGGAEGADTLGEGWAIQNHIAIDRFVPNWQVYGNAAGFRRNAQMVDLCNRACIFWDGDSKGTKITIGLLEQKGIKTHLFIDTNWKQD